MKKVPVIAVVGGGAAGLAAAIEATRCLRQIAAPGRVVLIEKMDRVGKKILATGNGRCNLTNRSATMEDYFGDQSFLRTAMEAYPPEENISFFESMGLLCKTEEEGRVYPRSGVANSVLDVLRYETTRLGVEYLCNREIDKIKPVENGFILSSNDGALFCSQVILATGGKAAPKLGSTGAGYKLLKELGYFFTPMAPALVQLVSDSPYPKQVKGIRFTGTGKLLLENRVMAQENGEFLFTDYGLSGVAAMQLSRYYARIGKNCNNSVSLQLDFMNDYSFQEVCSLLEQRVRQLRCNNYNDFLLGLFHRKICETILKAAGFMPGSCKGKILHESEIKRVAHWIKDFRLSITGTKGFDNAQVTSGGVDTRQFSGQTMVSKRHPGLYAAGEILDVDGPCGGYNLQWAWSSGRLAGKSAAQAVME